jgi:hypothetical protein
MYAMKEEEDVENNNDDGIMMALIVMKIIIIIIMITMIIIIIILINWHGQWSYLHSHSYYPVLHQSNYNLFWYFLRCSRQILFVFTCHRLLFRHKSWSMTCLLVQW